MAKDRKDTNSTDRFAIMGYLRKEIIEKCEKGILDVSNFYKADFINYRGKTSDTCEYYTEIVAEYACNNIERFSEIRKIKREASYRVYGHDGIYSDTSNRLEERTAMKMFNQCQDGSEFDFIGRVIDYQTPLKNRKTDDAGKIDLLSVKEDTVFILELKKEDSTETMLRCVLEGYTYLKTVDEEKLFNDFKLKNIKNIYASPLVFRGKEQWREMQEDRPQLFRLMKLVGSKPYYIDIQENKYIITEDE